MQQTRADDECVGVSWMGCSVKKPTSWVSLQCDACLSTILGYTKTEGHVMNDPNKVKRRTKHNKTHNCT